MEEIAPSLLHGKLGRVQVADHQYQTICHPGARLMAGAHARSMAPVEVLRAYRRGRNGHGSSRSSSRGVSDRGTMSVDPQSGGPLMVPTQEGPRSKAHDDGTRLPRAALLPQCGSWASLLSWVKRHLGPNANRPINAPPRIRRVGLIRLRRNTANTAAAIMTATNYMSR